MNTKTILLATFTTAAFIALPTVASASPIGPVDGFWGWDEVGFEQSANVRQIERRIERQQRRIVNGKAEGSLTRGEYRKLMRANMRLNRKLQRALRDGFISPREEGRLFAMLEVQSMRIRQLKNNHRVARFNRQIRRRPMRPDRVSFRF